MRSEVGIRVQSRPSSAAGQPVDGVGVRLEAVGPGVVGSEVGEGDFGTVRVGADVGVGLGPIVGARPDGVGDAVGDGDGSLATGSWSPQAARPATMKAVAQAATTGNQLPCPGDVTVHARALRALGHGAKVIAELPLVPSRTCRMW